MCIRDTAKNWLHLGRVACILEKHSEQNIHTQRNIQNIPNETNRKRLSHSAVPDSPVYTTTSLTARSMKAQHSYMHTHMHDSACIRAYTHTRIQDTETYLHTCIQTYMHTYIHTYTHTRQQLGSTHTCIHTKHTHIHTYIRNIHIYIYTHTYTEIQRHVTRVVTWVRDSVKHTQRNIHSYTHTLQRNLAAHIYTISYSQIQDSTLENACERVMCRGYTVEGTR
jgi:hypothetical protein